MTTANGVIKLPIEDIHENPDNPRFISDDSFKKLVQSIKEFPEMADVRPIVINKQHMILGGNMRFKAMQEAGWTEIPVRIVDWSEAKQREFIIKDNVSGGEWDEDDLYAKWDTEQLREWGLEIDWPEFEPTGIDDQGKLDEKAKVTCPECGHEFET